VSWVVIALAAMVFVLAGLVGVFFLFMTIVKKTARRDADDAIQPLRDLVLRLFERVEALKRRHERLVGAGAAGVAPPEGETRKALDEASAKLQAYFELWTELQQRLDRCRALVDAQTGWGRVQLDEARDLAQQKETVSPKADALAKEIEPILARLEEAPARAVAAAEKVRAAGGDGMVRLADFDARLRSDPLGASMAAEAAAGEEERRRAAQAQSQRRST